MGRKVGIKLTMAQVERLTRGDGLTVNLPADATTLEISLAQDAAAFSKLQGILQKFRNAARK